MSFAEFREHDRNDHWQDVSVRSMETADVEPVAAILAEREGASRTGAVEVVSGWTEPDAQRLVLVAEHHGRIQGYGKAEWLAPADHGGDAPAGWYLTGLVVAPPARRHGIGARLTEHRIAALASETDDLWYFANQRNRATIALHERYGFVVHTHDFSIPGVVFDGGHGALFRLRIAGP